MNRAERRRLGKAMAPPADIAAMLRQGLKWHREGQLDAAAASYRSILAEVPGQPQANHLLGLVEHQRGDHEAARQLIGRALLSTPGEPQRLADLGIVLNALHRPGEAIEPLRQALAMRPDDSRIHNLLAASYLELDRPEDAAACYREALRRDTGNAAMHNNLGNALAALGQIEAGIASYRQALALDPGYADAHSNLGHALAEMGELDAAVVAYDRALQLQSDHAGAWLNRGLALTRQGRLQEAAASFERVLTLDPDAVEALQGLGDGLVLEGRTAEAVARYREALGLRPDHLGIRSSLLFTLNYLEGQRPEQTLAEVRRYADALPPPGGAAWRNDPGPARRLKVGLVSGDLNGHAVSNFLLSVLPEIGTDAVELFAYATASRRDAITERLRQSVPNWRQAAMLSDARLAELIRADGIDILVDLSGHSAHNRLPVFGRKPAPVQVTWLGYSGTTGLTAMDYLIGDQHVAPPGAEGQFSEKIWRLPDAYLCFAAPDPTPDIAPLPAQANGRVTFGSFNTINKLSPATIALWASVLGAVPGSQLLLKHRMLGVGETAARLVRQFEDHGIGRDRLDLRGHAGTIEKHLGTYAEVDIGLDPFPYNGTTTTCEALWMGVPVLSLAGDRFVARVGASLLANVELGDWIAADADAYLRKARDFAADLDTLARLRAGLRHQMAASPLMDAPRFARNLEAAWRGMWAAWCALPERDRLA